jgi:general secretion pathway protein H
MRDSPVVLAGKPVHATAPRCQRGFSLLELLVALMVIVLVTTMVNLTVSSGGQDIQLESMVRNLADVGSYALDEAQMTGGDFGLLIEEEVATGETSYSYRWLEHAIDGWRDPVSGKEVFARQQLPPGVGLELELEDAPVVELSLDEQDEKKGEAEVLAPQVVFYASGETTVGAINVRELGSGDLLWRVQWDLFGHFDVLRRGVPDEEGEEEEEN